MSDPDRRNRGVEPPLTLDKRRVPRSRGPAPVTLIVSVIILIVAAGAILWLYRGGVRGGGGPPTVGAPVGEDRTAAPAQPPTPDAAAGLSIYKDNTAPPSPPAFTAPPEEPAGRVSGPPPQTAAPSPPVSGSATPTPADRAATKGKTKTTDQIGDLIDGASPEAKTTKPSKPARAAKADTQDLRSAPAAVQIGAFSSQAQADQVWSAAAAAAPGDMAGRGKKVVAVVKDGHTLYRTSITGFASRESAQALCARLQAAGRTCFVR